MPTVESMRDYLISKYAHSKEWKRKVEHMSTPQVTAIYFRMIDAEAKKNKATLSIFVKATQHSVFICDDCKQSFSTDNPDTTECRECGSTHIRKLT